MKFGQLNLLYFLFPSWEFFSDSGPVLLLNCRFKSDSDFQDWTEFNFKPKYESIFSLLENSLITNSESNFNLLIHSILERLILDPQNTKLWNRLSKYILSSQSTKWKQVQIKIQCQNTSNIEDIVISGWLGES